MKINLHFLPLLWISIILASSTLVGCATQTSVPSPILTQDPVTPVAPQVKTLDDQITVTPQPDPTAASSLLPAATPYPPTLTSTVTSTATSTRPALAVEVLNVWTYPSTKTGYHGNEGFGIAIYLKNTGSATWEPGYRLKLTGHKGPAEITVQVSADLTVAVPQDGKVEFDLWGFGSETAGKQEYTYKLFTGDGIVVTGSEATVSFTSLP